MKQLSYLLLLLLLLVVMPTNASERYNFNAAWLLSIGDDATASQIKYNDDMWQQVTLPYAFNQKEAFSRNCGELSDTVMWYRKHFRLPKSSKGKRVYIEFEGARFGTTVYLNGKRIGLAENGVMAFGFELTPYINYKGDNVLAVRVDNSWNYHEQTSGSTFQWNNKNFYCNYGGLNKNVWLHITPQLHQTLPLYSNLGTTGVYVWSENSSQCKVHSSCDNNCALIHVEAQVVNHTGKAQDVKHHVEIIDMQGNTVASFDGKVQTIAAGDTVTLKSEGQLVNPHLWSWGYGYLYTVKSYVAPVGAKATETDCVSIQTGFRQTDFKDGMFSLNGRVLQLKGFAQRSTNEWPAVGISIPASMSDYSNRMMLGCNGNFVRWMHVTPSKQDVRSFDRLGLIQAMPAGDAEKDVTGRRWEQRKEVMRDAIIYNRNNPSVIFYEGGNNEISEEHMEELVALKEQYDPHGGRAMGSRNMLSSKSAEYGGEMLYVNKSAGKPMWQMEYNRDEGIRRYWDEWSYPYHKEGDGPLYRGDAHVVAYNHNQDGLAVENIRRWNEYFLARPGQGRRVNSGGAKIIFSDSNTHARGEKNYRTSGDVDAMRIPKDSYFCHQVMWDGWVDPETEHTYIIGHWNYELSSECKVHNSCGNNCVLKKPVYVCSTADSVKLYLNDRPLGWGRRSDTFLFTWDSVKYEPGTLRAEGYSKGVVSSSYELTTAGKPVSLRMHWIDFGDTLRANGADLRICEVEAVDSKGQRCPLDDTKLKFSLTGEGEYLGGISGIVPEAERLLNEEQTLAHDQGREIKLTGASAREGHSADTNGILSDTLCLEAGVCRVMVRTTKTPGEITLTATPLSASTVSGTLLSAATLSISSVPCEVKDGFYIDDKGQAMEADWAALLPSYLERGETSALPSYKQELTAVDIKSIEVAVNTKDVGKMTDDDEATQWKSDGLLDNAWIRVTLVRPAMIKNISLRMNGFRTTSYPLEVIAENVDGDSTDANGVPLWQGYTPKNLGDCYLAIDHPVMTDTYLIRMMGEATVKEAFAAMTELAAKKNVSTKASKSNVLSIIELEMRE